jgi:cardiolipin synthase
MPDDLLASAPRESRRAALRADAHPWLNVPNMITLARLCAVPIAIWLVLRLHLIAAFWLFVAAAASDAVDGWLARRNGPTLLGTLLDPVADKALLVGMFITLTAVHLLPDWLTILVVFRDLLIVGGVLILSVVGLPVVIRPLFISKVNTAAQILLVAVTLLLAGTRLHSWTQPVLIALVTATTLASGGAYIGRVGRSR